MRTAVIKRSNISSSNDHHCGQSHRFHRFPHVHHTLARFYLMTAADFSRPDRSVYFSTLRARATQFRLQFLRSISIVNQTQNWIPFALPPHPITHLGKVCFALCVQVCVAKLDYVCPERTLLKAMGGKINTSCQLCADPGIDSKR